MPGPPTNGPEVIMIRATVMSIAMLAAAASAALATDPAAPRPQFRRAEIVDEQQGLVMSTIMVPVDWKVTSKVTWTYGDVSHPVRATARAEAPDGSAWVEYFPIEIFFWLQPVPSTVKVGTRSLGMIHKPNIQLDEAMKSFVVAPYRGKKKDLQVLGSRPVNGLAQAFGASQLQGQAMATRLRYAVGAATADEDVYAMLGAGNQIPYTGPQGTWYESHRPLVLAHAVGATGGKLESLYPMLSYIATSVKMDPVWEQRRQQLVQQISEEFNKMIARGYQQIQAAAALSKAISANNDAMLAGMEARRAQQNAADQARRAAANAGGGGGDSSSGFDDYIRGTERMKDPYWGESEHSYNEQYKWTDGQGNYRHSNDPGFDPNIGTGGGPNWQRMEPAGR